MKSQQYSHEKTLKNLLSYCPKTGKSLFFMKEFTIIQNVESYFFLIERKLISININYSPKFHEYCSKHFRFIVRKLSKPPLFMKKIPLLGNVKLKIPKNRKAAYVNRYK